MAVPWLTVGKLVISNLDTIVGVARPLFTRRKAESLAAQADVVNQQIAELQGAVSGNSEQIKDLAAQLKEVVTALEEAAVAAAAERRRARGLAIAAICVSALAVVTAVAAMMR